MNMPSPRAMLPFLAALALSGCATKSDYPSLARSPVEQMQDGEPAPAAAPGRIGGSGTPAPAAAGVARSEQALPTDLAGRLAGLESSAREAHARFAAQRARADALTGAAWGAAVGSEAWSQATVAVADLTSARSDAMVSLGELDRLYVEARVAAAERNDDGDGGAIAAVRDKVTAWVADEDAVLAELSGRLKG